MRYGYRRNELLEMYFSDIYTVTASLSGISGISVPAGRSPTDLPVGMQILCNHFQEAKMLRIADAFEKAGGFEN